MVFPEGTSFGDLKLRKIKTGTARIALGVQEKNDFKLNLRIIPIGLYYSSPTRFGSKVYVNVGKPIVTDGWKEPYEKDEFYAVQKLTKEIKNSLEQLTIHTQDEEQENLFYKIKRIYKSRLFENYNLEKDKQEEFRLTQEISKAIQYFAAVFPSKFQLLKSKIEECDQLMNQLKSTGTISSSNQQHSSSYLKIFIGFLYAIVGFIPYLFGYLHNFLPFRVPRWAAKKITREVEYHAPISMTIGIFAFPIFYGFFGFIFNQFVSAHWAYISVYLITLPLSGFYALHYYHFIKTGKTLVKEFWNRKGKQELVSRFQTLKDEITSDLDRATLEYLNRL